jgi:hypothetical protein
MGDVFVIKTLLAGLLMLVCSAPIVSYGQSVPEQSAAGDISGTVLDVNGGVVLGAQVTLVASDGSANRTVMSDDAGQFSFPGLAPGKFKCTIASAGFEPYASSEIVLSSGEKLILPEFRLSPAATTTDVQVSVTQLEIATEQLQVQEQQRVLGIFPHSLADPFSFVGTGIFAAAEQWQNTFPGYGQGAQGYAKRYAAAYADEALSRMIGSAIMPSLLHQDPRYFYRGTGSKKARAVYAISQAVICRGDNGKMQPNYSYVLGSFAAGGISNLYHPAGDRGAGLTIGNGFLNVGAHAIDNLAREFLFRKLTPKVPDYAQGKP